VELLVVDEILHQFLIALWNAAGNQLVQHTNHLGFRKSPAIEENLAQGKHLAVRQANLV